MLEPSAHCLALLSPLGCQTGEANQRLSPFQQWQFKAQGLIGSLRPLSQGKVLAVLATNDEDPIENSYAYYAASTGVTAVFEFEQNMLITRGVVLGEIDGLAGSPNTSLVQSSSSLNASSSRRAAYSISVDAGFATKTLISVCKSLVLERKDHYLGIAMPVEEFLNDFLWLCAYSIPAVSTTTIAVHACSRHGTIQHLKE